MMSRNFDNPSQVHWSIDMTRCLIRIWRHYTEQGVLVGKTKRNNVAYTKMTQELKHQCHLEDYTVPQLHKSVVNKLKYLKSRYARVEKAKASGKVKTKKEIVEMFRWYYDLAPVMTGEVGYHDDITMPDDFTDDPLIQQQDSNQLPSSAASASNNTVQGQENGEWMPGKISSKC